MNELPKLPIGIQTFAQIRERGYADRYKGEDVTLIGLAVDSFARRVGGCRIEKL